MNITARASGQIDLTGVTARAVVQAWPHDRGRVHKAIGDRIELALPPRDAPVPIGKSDRKRG